MGREEREGGTGGGMGKSGRMGPTRPSGPTKAEMPVFAARAIATRFSTARSGSVPRCCGGPLVRPNHASLVMLVMKLAPPTTKPLNRPGAITS